MKTLRATIITLLLFATTAAFAEMEGAWAARPDEKDPSTLQVSLTYSRTSHHSISFKLAEVGLTREQVYAAAQTPSRFSWKRDAGTVLFEGAFRNGRGGGQMVFTPNRNYLQAIQAMGVGVGTIDDEELFILAVVDVSPAYIRAMQAEGFRVSLEKYMNMAMFRVTPEYVREMRRLLGADVPASKLVEMRIHDITAEYVREMRAARPGLTLNDLLQTRIFELTPQFAEEMARAGYPNLSQNALLQFRIHKVTPEYIRELSALGYKGIAANRLVEMRIHGVTPEYIRQLAAAGYRNIPVQKLMEMRMHGLEPSFLQKMSDQQKRND